MTILLQSDARRLILQEFGIWANNYPRQHQHSQADGLLFFQHLQNHKSHLLQFRYPGQDQWGVVERWLSDAKLISD